MRQFFGCAVAALALAGCTASYSGPVDTLPAANAVTVVTPPERDASELQVLFWNDEQRNTRFRDMESWFAGHEVKASADPRVLPEGERLPPRVTVLVIVCAVLLCNVLGTGKELKLSCGEAPEGNKKTRKQSNPFAVTVISVLHASCFLWRCLRYGRTSMMESLVAAHSENASSVSRFFLP